MYRIILACYGVPESAGVEAAHDITDEFRAHRQWHTNVLCNWDGVRLVLQADNDYDSDGLALLDDFLDCISAYIAESIDGEIKVESVLQVPGNT